MVDVVEKGLRKRLKTTSPKPIGLPTGNTMIPFYKALVDRLGSWSFNDRQQLFDSWCSFNLDEYVGLGDQDLTSFN